MKFRHCYNAYFRWNTGAFQRKVQGFRAVLPEILALEQSHLVLKAMAFKACGFVQYALYKQESIENFYAFVWTVARRVYAARSLTLVQPSEKT